jgi:hypothetical protein
MGISIFRNLKLQGHSPRLALLTFLPLAGVMLAQSGQINGRLTDATGAAVAGAKVRVKNVATNQLRETSSAELGLYTVPLLNPGVYDLEVSREGFKQITRKSVSLAVDQRLEVNFTLEVGAISEKVEVSAQTLQLNTVDGSVGQVIDNKRIVEMPLNGRYYGDLALLSSGAVPSAAGSRFGGFSSGGQRVTQNNYLIDGIDNNSVELAGAGRRAEMVQPSIDAVQEFKVQTNAYSAEFGRAMGAVVNLTLKSGTNQLHGAAFEFLRNEKLDARNFFTPATSAKPPFKRNQYGFAIGGPVLLPKLYDGRNKTFFFGDYEGTRIRETSTIVSTIPTLRMRSGDFGELSRRVNDPQNGGAQFPGNVIPASRLDPVSQRLIALYPNPLNANLAANFTYLSPRIQDVDKWDIRIDQNIGSRDNFFWRLSKQDVLVPDTPSLPAPAYGGGNLDYITEGYNTGAGWNHIFTPNLLLSVRAGWNFALFKRDNPASTRGELLNARYGIRGGDNTLPGGFSQFSLTGYRALGIGGFNPVDRDSQNRQLSGDLTLLRGRHNFKFGAGILRSQNNILSSRNVVGNFTFNSQYTGDGAADFLLGFAQSWNWNTPINVQLRTYNFSIYAQDDWRLTNRLTLNLGVRYELSPPWVERYNKMGIFDIDSTPGRPSLVYAADGSRASRALISTDTNNFMPRIGLAFRLDTNTVLRAGYGLFYSYMEPFGDNEHLIGNPPFAYGVTLAGSTTAPALLLASGPPAGATDFTRATGLQFSSYERNPRQSAAHQWNFNIQRQLGADWLAEVGYSGSRGLHLLRQYEGNYSAPGPGALNSKRLFPSLVIPGTGITTSPLAEVYSHRNDGNSSYHALLAKLERRFSNGFTLLTSYTFSKAIGDTCGGSAQGNAAGCGYQDPRNLRAERSIDNQDVPHRYVVSTLYDLPFGRSIALPRPVSAVIGGWSIGSILTAQSGLPFSAVVAGNPANIGSINVVNRPDVIGDVYGTTRTLAQDFNTSALQRNAAFTLGNAGRNILRQRSQFGWDFSALRTWSFTDVLRLQFRFEAFQFTNTPRFGTPGNTLGAANFGTITSAATPRNLQFGLKLIF